MKRLGIIFGSLVGIAVIAGVIWIILYERTSKPAASVAGDPATQPADEPRTNTSTGGQGSQASLASLEQTLSQQYAGVAEEPLKPPSLEALLGRWKASIVLTDFALEGGGRISFSDSEEPSSFDFIIAKEENGYFMQRTAPGGELSARQRLATDKSGRIITETNGSEFPVVFRCEPPSGAEGEMLVGSISIDRPSPGRVEFHARRIR